MQIYFPRGCSVKKMSSRICVSGSSIIVTYTSGSSTSTTVLTVNVTDAKGCTTSCQVTLSASFGQGCTIGFWRNHTKLWDQSTDKVVAAMPSGLRFTTTTNFFTYFNIPVNTCKISNKSSLTMLEALI